MSCDRCRFSVTDSGNGQWFLDVDLCAKHNELPTEEKDDFVHSLMVEHGEEIANALHLKGVVIEDSSDEDDSN